MLIPTIAVLAVILAAALIAGRVNSRPQAARIPVPIRDRRSRRF